MSYKELNKDKLIELLNNKDIEIERLENDVDYWVKEYDEMENIKEELDTEIESLIINNGIKSSENFIWRLKIDNLYTEEFGKFINDYLKYYND